MIVLVGESGCGKTTIRNILIEKYGYKRAVSCTTRKPRKGEVEGVDYYFLTREEFERKIANWQSHYDKFLEYEEYNGNLYGLGREQCKIPNAVAIVEPRGLSSISAANKRNSRLQISSFYIYTSPEIRKERLRKRGDSEEQIQERLKTDEKLFEHVERKVTDVIFADFMTPDQIADRIHLDILQNSPEEFLREESESEV